MPDSVCEQIRGKRYDKTLNAVKNSITLTIGEDANFLQAGGMLSLQSDRAGVLFDGRQHGRGKRVARCLANGDSPGMTWSEWKASATPPFDKVKIMR